MAAPELEKTEAEGTDLLIGIIRGLGFRVGKTEKKMETTGVI